MLKVQKKKKRPKEDTVYLRVWVMTEVFSVATKLSGFVSRQWVLCCDRIWSRPGVPRSWPWLLSVVTMSQLRFPYCDQDVRGRRSGLQRELG